MRQLQTPIDNDGANDTELDETGAADLFLRNLADPDENKRRASDEDDEDHTEEEPEQPEDGSDDEAPEETPGDEDDADDDGEPEEKGERKYADDEGTYVKITVDDEEHEVPVKDLKRLFGQEKSLTQKSQQVAERRKQVDADGARYLAQTQVLLERA